MSNANKSRYLDQVRELGRLRAVIMQGETETTYEAINVRVSLGGVDVMLFQYADLIEFLGFNHGKAQDFVWHAIKGSDVTVGPYIASYYWDAFEQARQIGSQLLSGEQSYESRQLIIGFPKIHCFQNIQILFRHNAINVIANMRSCNYEVNFMTDLYICYMVAEVLMCACRCTKRQINVMMNIGSLHIYK